MTPDTPARDPAVPLDLWAAREAAREIKDRGDVWYADALDVACRAVQLALAVRDSEHAAQVAELARLLDALRGFIRWGDSKCPCVNEEPNPCTLCGGSVENLEACKAADRTLPPDLLRDARTALAETDPKP